MINDAVMVALIRETVLSESESRQAAARLILEAIRHHNEIDASDQAIEVVRAEAGKDVATEMRYLLDRLGLN